MPIRFQVLTEEEKSQVHERTLKILEQTGVRVDTAIGREILAEAGAHVNETSKIVRFPRPLVEESLRLCPKEFTLGARRPGWNLEINAGNCVLLIDGEAITVLDRETGERRSGTFADSPNRRH
jgi:trimethylamine--corrinoid protein Co-methyltransferase